MRPLARTTTGAVIIAVVAILAAAAAQARPSLYTMTCSQAQAFVRSKGAVVVDTAPNVTRRVVSNGSYCDRLQMTKPFFGKTTDNPQCRIGLRCATETMSAE
jgi:fucose permease